MIDVSVSQDAQPRVYVVSMLRSTERRKAIAEQLEQLGVSFTFVDAVDASKANPDWLRAQVDEEAMQRSLGRPMSGPEIGCALSHRQVYKMIVEQGNCGAVILEDDITVSPVFLDALAWFSTNGARLAEISAIYHLGALSKHYGRLLILPRRQTKRISHRLHFAEPPTWQPTEVNGTFGYYATRAAARNLLTSPRLEASADHWSTWARRTGSRLFVAVPAIVIHPPDYSNSEIHAARMAIDCQQRAMQYRSYQLAHYLYHGIRRRIIRFVIKPVAEAILK